MASKDEPRTHFETHESSRTEASNGEGTVKKSPKGKTLDHPVLDGSTLTDEEEKNVVNPWRGQEDPALVRHPEGHKKSKNPYGG